MDCQPTPSRFEILRVALKLGCISFGGPAAHLGYFHAEYVQRRRWLTEASYADLVALCQFLPGPASSQLGFSIGLLRGGLLGGMLAWIGFTLPSAVLMILCGYGLAVAGNLGHAGWLEGLKLAAVAVVAQAVWTMGRKLCPDRTRIALALMAAATVLTLATAWTQIAVLLAGGFFGWAVVGGGEPMGPAADTPLRLPGWSRRGGLVCLLIFLILLGGVPLLRTASGNPAVAVFDGFFRAGSLVFGGGHVVLPLLQTATVSPGWLDENHFLAGYGLAQSLPGPLFAFSAYLGTVMTPPRPGGWTGALLCLSAIYLPSALLVLGVLPFWESLRREAWARAALGGTNAAVVGLLLAALCRPVWTSAVHSPGDFVVVIVAFALLVGWEWPPWLVVGAAALGGTLLL